MLTRFVDKGKDETVKMVLNRGRKKGIKKKNEFKWTELGCEQTLKTLKPEKSLKL